MILGNIIYNIDRTLKEIDYTRKAYRNLARLADSEEFEDMDSEAILNYLLRDMEIVVFKDQLKRYLYERAGIQEPFSKVEEDIYCEIIRDAFQENRAPHSFGPTTKKWSATIKGWLTSSNVQRQTIFLLGFGLDMSAEDVSAFLVNVIKEDDFHFTDKDEAIYYYCYKNHFRYQKAVELQERYEDLDKEGIHYPKNQKFDLQKILENPVSERKERDFLEYLFWLKQTNISDDNGKKAYENFEQLLLEVKRSILKIYETDVENGERRGITFDQITNGDVEKMICCGIPVTKNGNLEKMSFSCLKNVFQKYRLSRQRITGLLNRKLKIERFDLLTLNFFLFAQMECEDGKESVRLKGFIDSMNHILRECGMGEIYPVNPYESYVMICLLSQWPLPAYADVWERSFQIKEDE